MNLSLIVVSVAWFAKAPPGQKPYGGWLHILTTIGRISLPIYLWHMVPMFLLKGWDVHQALPMVYYAVSVVSTLFITFVVIKLEGRSRLLDKILYGS